MRTNFEKITVEIYARDLNPNILNDGFFGEGFEAKLKEANEKGKELIVGKFYDVAQIEE